MDGREHVPCACRDFANCLRKKWINKSHFRFYVLLFSMCEPIIHLTRSVFVLFIKTHYVAQQAIPSHYGPCETQLYTQCTISSIRKFIMKFVIIYKH